MLPTIVLLSLYLVVICLAYSFCPGAFDEDDDV